MNSNIESGCPVSGPGGSCYAPCCASSSGCLGTENCPYDPIYGLDHAGPRVNSNWYHNACPNTYAFPDDDCSNYGHSPDAGCGDNNRVTMTICPNGMSSGLIVSLSFTATKPSRVYIYRRQQQCQSLLDDESGIWWKPVYPTHPFERRCTF